MIDYSSDLVLCSWVLMKLTHKSSSVLIYSHLEQSVYTQDDWQDAMLIIR